MVHDAGSDGLLAGVGKHLHHGEHGVEVLAAPQFHVHDTRHGVGVLPQVEVESPVFGRRQLAAAHLDLECHFGLLALVAGEDYLTFIYTRARDGRHPHVDPNWAGGAAGNTVDVGTIDHVGDHRRVEVGLVGTVAAVGFAVMVELVGHHISHKSGVDGLGVYHLSATGQGCSLYAWRDDVVARPYHSLSHDALASPCVEPQGLCHAPTGHVHLGVADIGGAPRHLHCIGHARPYLVAVVRLGVGQFAGHQGVCLCPHRSHRQQEKQRE